MLYQDVFRSLMIAMPLCGRGFDYGLKLPGFTNCRIEELTNFRPGLLEGVIRQFFNP
jgi:hypothetical protein